MSLDSCSFVCRLCQKSDTWFIDIFDASETNGILVCEVIRELVQLEVNVGDGLPNTACHECWRKLAEFHDFKRMCFKSADDLRRKSTIQLQGPHQAEDRFTVKEEPIEFDEDPFSGDGELTAQYTEVKSFGHDSTVCRSQTLKFSNDEVVPERDISSYQARADALRESRVSRDKGDASLEHDGKEIKPDTVPAIDPAGSQPMNDAIKEEPDDLFEVHEMNIKEELAEAEELDSARAAALRESRVSRDKGDASLEHDGKEITPNTVPVTDPAVSHPMNDAIKEEPEDLFEVHEMNIKEEPPEAEELEREDEKYSDNPRSHLAVFVPADCGLPMRGDGLVAKEERDPLGADGDGNNPSTLITMSEEGIVREESFVPSMTTERCKDVPRKKVKLEPSDSDSVNPESYAEAGSSMAPSTSSTVPSDAHGTSVPFGPWATGPPLPVAEGTAPVPPVPQGTPHSADGAGPGRTDVDGNSHPMFHQCDECGKVCISRYLLKVHKRTHVVVDQFVCKSCGKRFRTKGNLKIHTATHTGEKPYPCPSCPMRFGQKGTLERHLRTHSGERPYECQDCGRSFTERDTLKKHMHTHTGEKPHGCDVCGKRYVTRNQLILHQKVHSGEKPFCCESCGRRFYRKYSLKYHLQTHNNKGS